MNNEFERVKAREHEAYIECVDEDKNFEMVMAIHPKKLAKICKEEGVTLKEHLDHMRNSKRGE